MNKNVNYSYWELKHYFKNYDLAVIGSGIVGLNAAISFKRRNKKARVIVLERGIIPSGASTRNAGFACFGSPSELLDDLTKMSEEGVWETVKLRWRGLQMLEKRLGKKNLNLQWKGGIELFDDHRNFNSCTEELDRLNRMIKKHLKLDRNFAISTKETSHFGGVIGSIRNRHEGQIDTSLMMASLIDMAQREGVIILNHVQVMQINDRRTEVSLETSAGEFATKKVIVAVNGFATQLLKIQDVKPARAQVLVTKPIKGLKIKGCYHYQQGYYYFREVDGRILLGGGRNLDLSGETTFSMDLNPVIQSRLDQLLKKMILPDIEVEVEARWAGIMGVGNEKKPIIGEVSPNVIAAVRMGGMGVAIGTWVGDKAAAICSGST